jgi:hypothetical protein
MRIGGSTGHFIKRAQILVLLSLGVLLFQNCGNEGGDQGAGLYVGSAYGNGNCLSETVDCGENSEYLQITLDITDGQVLGSGETQLLVTGRCNTGNFPSYEIRWEIMDSNAATVRNGSSDDTCLKGKYHFSIGVAGLNLSTIYTLRVHMIGIDVQAYENFSNNGSAQIDFSKQ